MYTNRTKMAKQWRLWQPMEQHLLVILLYENNFTYVSSIYVNFMSRLCLVRKVLLSNGISIFDGCGMGRPTATREGVLLVFLSSPFVFSSLLFLSVLVCASEGTNMWPVTWMTCKEIYQLRF